MSRLLNVEIIQYNQVRHKVRITTESKKYLHDYDKWRLVQGSQIYNWDIDKINSLMKDMLSNEDVYMYKWLKKYHSPEESKKRTNNGLNN